jgi:hypothetical protein
MVAVLGLGTIIHYSWAWLAVLGTVLTAALIYQAHKTNIAVYRSGKIKVLSEK